VDIEDVLFANSKYSVIQQAATVNYLRKQVQLFNVYDLANKNVRPCKNRTEMYIGRVVCCPLVSHVEYAPTGQTDRQTPDLHIMLTAIDAATVRRPSRYVIITAHPLKRSHYY